MEKIVKKWGDSLIIVLNTEDKKIYGLKVGQIIDLTITKINGVEKKWKYSLKNKH